MKKFIKIALGAALPVVWAAGCSDYLKGGALSNNPNNPVQGSATNTQLWESIQTDMTEYQEGDMGRAIAQWMQQLLGVARQQATIYDYTNVSNATYDGEFQRPYIGGGLVDLRTLERSTGPLAAVPDPKFLGIAQVMEAWEIGETADVWGDIPYSQADSFTVYPTPILDTQQSVYNAVEALLSAGITNIAAGAGGPGAADLVYAGSSAKWTALAHTLKARFYLHQAEKLGAAMYTSANTEALLGITDATGAGDYIAYHSSTNPLSWNSWFQFMDGNGGTGRAGDLVAGGSVGASNGQTKSTLWLMMVASGDSRFAEYFDPANGNGGEMAATRLRSDFRQPFVTYNENQLIIAEANCQPACNAAGKTALNTEQAAWATATTWHASRVVPQTAVPTLTDVMTEKYITLFQNKEVWNDWKRTCIPALVPVDVVAQFGGGKIPARMWYGETEQITNPNIPPVGTPPNGDTNWNDPVRCP